MSIVLVGSTSGSVTLQEPAVAGSTTLTLPATTGTVVVGSSAVSATGQIPFSTDGSTYTPTAKIVSGTAVASTSGTSIDFTSIPSWVKRITVMFNGVSTSGTSNFLFQLGDSGGIETTGYQSVGSNYVGATTSTIGFVSHNTSASITSEGFIQFSTLGSNVWVGNGNFASVTAGQVVSMAGSKTLSDTLTQVRITTVNGTDTFDAGSINILYE
jgi:hypothetical protein